MAWRRTGDKPLPETMLTQFTDIYAALGGDELTLQVPAMPHVALVPVNVEDLNWSSLHMQMC